MKAAETLEIVLGLENRYHYHQLPTPEDFEILFKHFAGAPVGYWHDAGHARVIELLGGLPAGEMLARYGDRLVGFHLHDAIGLDDHMPPGDGEIDFNTIAPFVGPETLQVVELKPGTPMDATLRGVRFLKNKGFY